MAAQSDYPGQTNFVLHQRQLTFRYEPHHMCAVCNHNPPHLTASGFQISGALAVIRLVAKGYVDYLSYGNDDISVFFGFYGVPHPIVPTFLIRYFLGNVINEAFDTTERLLQACVWKIEKRCCPALHPNYLSRISRSQ